MILWEPVTQFYIFKASRYYLVESMIRMLLFGPEIEPLLVLIEWNVPLLAEVAETDQCLVSQLNTEWVMWHSYRFLCLHILASRDSTERFQENI